MLNNWIKGFVVVLILNAFCLVPAVAEEQQDAVKNNAAYSDDQLKSFILANVGIYQVQQQFAAKMPDMDSEEQKQDLIQSANQEMEQVLQNAGFTADEYNEMGQNIQSDTQLQEKVNSIATEMFPQQEEGQQ